MKIAFFLLSIFNMLGQICIPTWSNLHRILINMIIIYLVNWFPVKTALGPSVEFHCSLLPLLLQIQLLLADAFL